MGIEALAGSQGKLEPLRQQFLDADTKQARQFAGVRGQHQRRADMRAGQGAQGVGVQHDRLLRQTEQFFDQRDSGLAATQARPDNYAVSPVEILQQGAGRRGGKAPKAVLRMAVDHDAGIAAADAIDLVRDYQADQPGAHTGSALGGQPRRTGIAPVPGDDQHLAIVAFVGVLQPAARGGAGQLSTKVKC